MDKEKIKKLAIKLIVSVGLFSFLLWKIDEREMLGKFNGLNYFYVVLVVLLIIVNYVVSAIRWKRLLIFEKSEKASLLYMISLYFTGSFFNNFMPTSIGGDVYKVIKLGGKIDSKTNAFTATFMERFLGVIALGAIASISFVKLYNWFAVGLIALAIICAFVGFKFINILTVKFPKIKKFVDPIKLYVHHKNVLIFAFGFSFLVQVVSILSQYYVFAALNLNPPLLYSFFVLPLISLAGFVIPSLNGLGVQDTLYITLFSAVGLDSTAILSASVLFHIIRLVVSLFGGLLYAVGADD